MADNVPITPGSGKTIATDEVTDGTLGTVQVQFIKLMDGTLDSTNKLSVSAGGAAKVDGSGVTQPVSGTVTANAGTNLNTSALALDATLTNGAEKSQVVDGAGTSVGPIQTISGTNYLPVVLAASGTAGSPIPARTVQVGGSDGTNLRTIKTSATGVVSIDGSATTQPISGTVAVTQSTSPWVGNITQVASTTLGTPAAYGTTPTGNAISVNSFVTNPVQVAPANLGVSATGAAAAAVTATLPAAGAGLFHYITALEIVAYSTVARTGSATVVLVTSTNLPGSNVWDFQSAAAIGTSERQLTNPNSPIKSSVANTATTIVCPATTSVIWRINVYYFAA